MCTGTAAVGRRSLTAALGLRVATPWLTWQTRVLSGLQCPTAGKGCTGVIRASSSSSGWMAARNKGAAPMGSITQLSVCQPCFLGMGAFRAPVLPDVRVCSVNHGLTGLGVEHWRCYPKAGP
jgi:hypothetical protein